MEKNGFYADTPPTANKISWLWAGYLACELNKVSRPCRLAGAVQQNMGIQKVLQNPVKAADVLFLQSPGGQCLHGKTKEMKADDAGTDRHRIAKLVGRDIALHQMIHTHQQLLREFGIQIGAVLRINILEKIKMGLQQAQKAIQQIVKHQGDNILRAAGQPALQVGKIQAGFHHKLVYHFAGQLVFIGVVGIKGDAAYICFAANLNDSKLLNGAFLQQLNESRPQSLLTFRDALIFNHELLCPS